MLTKNLITDDIYCKLIEYSFTKCDAVMFVSRKDGFDDDKISCLNKTVA